MLPCLAVSRTGLRRAWTDDVVDDGFAACVLESESCAPYYSQPIMHAMDGWPADPVP